MEKLLVTEDNDEIRTQLKWGLSKEYTVLLAKNTDESLALFIKNKPRVATLDLGLPPHERGTDEGFRCLHEMLRHNPAAKVIVITGNDQRENALKAIQAGAYDFYQKPINLEELKVIVKRAFHLASIEQENRALHQSLERQAGRLGGMIGQCVEMQAVFSTIRKVASSDAAILIQGESGTGKELVARGIHAMSLQKGESFVPINCGAIPENLLESELFGHEKGAFTGAHGLVPGKVEYAHKGTLFLDEIGELPARLQVKLLRFLQDKIIQRVGGREEIAVDARIIAATNKDLTREISDGRFREDLYYRIGVVTINIPALRDRSGDTIPLATYFLKRYSDLYKKRVRGFSAASLEQMSSYAWPGNVRELENKVQRAVIMSEGALVEPKDLGFAAATGERCIRERISHTLKEARDLVEKDMVVAALDRNNGNIARSAEDLGISRPTLYDILKKNGLYDITLNHEGPKCAHPHA